MKISVPPWYCGYHFDINVQMNYWLAEVANLSELHEPLFGLINDVRENGRKTAKEVYGCRGFWVVSHRTDDRFFTSPIKGSTIWPVREQAGCVSTYGSIIVSHGTGHSCADSALPHHA